MLWQYKLDKNFDLTLLVIFKKKLNADETIGRPFPTNRVFNLRLINFEVGFILEPFFVDYNRTARLKVPLKVDLNSIALHQSSSSVLSAEINNSQS